MITATVIPSLYLVLAAELLGGASMLPGRKILG
jgi:hypothetical protein